ncbi:MAG: DUF4976 domain-containing protein, partial [Verrucomicrobiae bacterium]|nr:DUF4976 domain-containing protein [Verrucomicrobiae bacterium]
NYELATRAPLIVAKPGMKAAGQGTNALVEFVDFYPTLAELAGLPIPAHVEGTSFAPLLENPELSWKKAAFSEMLRQQERLGRSIRTERYRYVEWRGPKGALLAKELYDHRSDPEETENLAERAEYAGTIDLLSRQLEAGWKSALP